MYSRTAGLLLIYSLFIKNGRRIISSTELFVQLTVYSKWRITQCCAEDNSTLQRKYVFYFVDRVNGVANISSYVSDRWQYLYFSEHLSTFIPMTTGVPQGSGVEPHLFLIYVDSLTLVSKVFDMLMYADDTLGCNINQDVGKESIHVRAKLLKISQWLDVTNLSLNVAKTKYNGVSYE